MQQHILLAAAAPALNILLVQTQPASHNTLKPVTDVTLPSHHDLMAAVSESSKVGTVTWTAKLDFGRKQSHCYISRDELNDLPAAGCHAMVLCAVDLGTSRKPAGG